MGLELATLLGVTGGLVLGLGVGWIAARHMAAVARARWLLDRSRVRHGVLPVLEARADALGVHRPAADPEDDPVEAAVELARRIDAVERRVEIALSDTMRAEALPSSMGRS
ncbi:MAG: hypothetical protein NZ898_08515 [Myxococcota bacterium]|nr:hypothetical protein [Myxococcota bacterium]MDW8363949.1 hypothetical protein [Myxococcales bacterium]